MYNFSSMSGWHQQTCDQIFYPEGCNVSVKRLCALPEQKDSLCTIISRHASFLSPICFLCNHPSSDCCSCWQYLHVPVLVTVTCWSACAGEKHIVTKCCMWTIMLDWGSSVLSPRPDLSFRSLSLSYGQSWGVYSTQEQFKLSYSLLPAKCFPGPFSVLKF